MCSGFLLSCRPADYLAGFKRAPSRPPNYPSPPSLHPFPFTSILCRPNTGQERWTRKLSSSRAAPRESAWPWPSASRGMRRKGSWVSEREGTVKSQVDEEIKQTVFYSHLLFFFLWLESLSFTVLNVICAESATVRLFSYLLWKILFSLCSVEIWFVEAGPGAVYSTYGTSWDPNFFEYYGAGEAKKAVWKSFWRLSTVSQGESPSPASDTVPPAGPV